MTELETIARHYGSTSQLSVLQEECAELIQAISKWFRSRRAGEYEQMDTYRMRIIEEVADVEIMIAQAEILLGLDRADIDAMKHYKVRREMGRIDNTGQGYGASSSGTVCAVLGDKERPASASNGAAGADPGTGAVH